MLANVVGDFIRETPCFVNWIWWKSAATNGTGLRCGDVIVVTKRRRFMYLQLS